MKPGLDATARARRLNSPAHVTRTLLLFGCVLLCACHKGDFAPVWQKRDQSSNSSAPYKLGTTIEFGVNGGSERYRIGGWSGTEGDYTWTDGKSAALLFAGVPARQPLRLTVLAAGMTNPPELRAQLVEVYANDNNVAEWTVGVKGNYSANIPPLSESTGGTLKIEFKLPQAFSPKQLGLTAEPRLLGICVYSLSITTPES